MTPETTAAVTPETTAGRYRRDEAVPALQAGVWTGGETAVVLLHGQPGTAGDWQWVLPLLEGRYTVVVPDRPGYGRTGGAATGFAGNADALAGLLDRLGLAQAVVVGHSWGGGVAVAFAGAHPERTKAMVLVSSVGPGGHLGWDDRLLALPVLGEALAAGVIGAAGYLLGRSRIQAVADRRLSGRARDAVASLTRLTGGGSAVWRSFVAEQRALVDELDQLSGVLGGIAVPTAVVHGRRDRLVPADVARANASAIPRSSLHILDGVGHLIPHDRPDAVAAAVDEVAAASAAG